MNPLIILAIGISTVLGLILILRVNAFLALITSAIVVSLMAPGTTESKISRVADSFGTAAGNIAIVIGLAAIIGECMMASGAADRIVQAFLNVLGQKRAPLALMGSGFVLAIPVFFDTVFYLLVPLARSLYRRTNKHYLLYILAISAGGAITHTLVPPTPGPLLMASTLGIDVGVMILIGSIVALPAAIVGLLFAMYLDKRMEIPFRDDKVVGTEDDDPHVPTSTPPLWLSLLPVVLPVLLIAANTGMSTLANNERPARLKVEDVTDWEALRSNLRTFESATPASALLAQLSENSVDLLTSNESLSNDQKITIVEDLNTVLARKSPSLYNNADFDSVILKRWKIADQLKDAELTEIAKSSLKRQLLMDDLLKQDYDSLQVYDRERLHRTLLEVSFPNAIAQHTWDTPIRNWSKITSVLGNANLALLFSTIIALYLLWSQTNPTLSGLSQTVEVSLMSGGTIILITAAGGAFGAMLKQAEIGSAIQKAFEGTGGSSGFTFILLGYSIAALMKVAQGSSTAAMIIVSGMMAAMIGNIDLGYHPVYLATAIGAGSLMGSWMNDSGFWIFTKMGRLTETESLKSWTVLLAVLSLVSLGMTILLSIVMPMA